MAVDDYGLKHKEKGLLSSTTTTVRTHDDHETVLGTTVTGKQVQLGAGQDVRLTAAAVAGQGDVVVAAGRNLTADTAPSNMTRRRPILRSSRPASSVPDWASSSGLSRQKIIMKENGRPRSAVPWHRQAAA